MNIKAISKEEFYNKNVIYFNNILDGFNNYDYIQLSPKGTSYEEVEKSYLGFIEELFYLNNNKVIIDFYKNKLDENGIKFIENRVSNEDKKLFNSLINCGNKDSIFFEIRDDSYINLLTMLNLKEIFFISFYFDKIKSTLWGNYNYAFPLFYDNKESEEKYKKIAEQHGLL